MAQKNERIVTPKFRVSFPQLFEAKAFDEGDAKFTLTMLFDKKTDLTPLKNAVKKAANDKWGDTLPPNLKLPFKDGNEKELDGYKDKIVVDASSKFRPQVVDQKVNIITRAEDIYAGCYARAAINAYAWEYSKGGKVLKRGVSFNLDMVQKLEEGEPFVKRANAEEVFDAVDNGSEDASNYESDDDFLI